VFTDKPTDAKKSSILRPRFFLTMATLSLCVVAAFSSLFLTCVSTASIETVGVGVYWDSDCRNQVSAINWSTLYPGMTKELTVYMRNEGNETAVLWLRTDNWDPPNASEYMTLSWTYTGQIEPQEILKVEFILAVSPEIEGITNFHFDIIVDTTSTVPGDANGDGVVNVIDLGMLGYAWLTEVGEPKFDPRVDFNGDGKINVLDLGTIGFWWLYKVPS